MHPMKNILKGGAIAFLLWVVTAMGAVTITSLPGEVRVGGFPEFRFRVAGLGTNWVARSILLREGQPVGELTHWERSFTVTSSNEVTGRFVWGLTRIIGVSGKVVWPKAGRYTVRLGVVEQSQKSLQSGSSEETDYSAETAEFTLVGTPPPIIIRRGTSPDGVDIFVSGNPGDVMELLWSSSLLSSAKVWSMGVVQIPPDGIWTSGYTNIQKNGFFRVIRKD